MKKYMAQAKTQYQYVWLSMDDGGRLWFDITWSAIMKKYMAQAKTQYQYAWLSMDDGGRLWYDITW